MFDGTTIKAGTTGQLVLSKLESSWAAGSSLRTTDFSVLTARVVPGDNGLNVIEYTAKEPGTAQLIVVVESGAAVNMGDFYVVASDEAESLPSGWVQEEGQWKYRMGNGACKSDGWLAVLSGSGWHHVCKPLAPGWRMVVLSGSGRSHGEGQLYPRWVLGQ